MRSLLPTNAREANAAIPPLRKCFLDQWSGVVAKLNNLLCSKPTDEWRRYCCQHNPNYAKDNLLRKLSVNSPGRWIVETTNSLPQTCKFPIGDLLMLESTRSRKQSDSEHHTQLHSLWPYHVQIQWNLEHPFWPQTTTTMHEETKCANSIMLNMPKLYEWSLLLMLETTRSYGKSGSEQYNHPHKDCHVQRTLTCTLRKIMWSITTRKISNKQFIRQTSMVLHLWEHGINDKTA